MPRKTTSSPRRWSPDSLALAICRTYLLPDTLKGGHAQRLGAFMDTRRNRIVPVGTRWIKLYEALHVRIEGGFVEGLESVPYPLPVVPPSVFPKEFRLNAEVAMLKMRVDALDRPS